MSDISSEHGETLPVDEAMQRLVVVPEYDAGNGPEPCVHTFIPSGFGMLGAHWSVEKARESMERYGVEEASGFVASAMGHTLVVVEDRDGRSVPVFFEARPAS